MHIQQLRLHAIFFRDTLLARRKKGVDAADAIATHLRRRLLVAAPVKKGLSWAFLTTLRGSTCIRGSASPPIFMRINAMAFSLTASVTASTIPGITTIPLP